MEGNQKAHTERHSEHFGGLAYEFMDQHSDNETNHAIAATNQIIMREIKFRYRLQLNVDSFGLYKKGDIDFFYMDMDSLERFPIDEKWDILSRDLATGLQDKDGTDIYEGDKLAPAFFVKSTKDHCEVIFYKGMLCLKPNGKLIQEYNPLYKSQELSRKAANDYVVVGNIHEDKHLIDKTN